MTRGRARIFASTLGVTAVQALAVWLVWRVFTFPYGMAVGLALAFLLTHIVAITILLAASLTTKLIRNRRVVQAKKLAPEIQKELGRHMAGDDRLLPLQLLAKRWPRVMSDSVNEALQSVRGSGRERLAQLATQIGLVQRWEALCSSRSASVRRESVAALGLAGMTSGAVSRALLDSDDMVRIEAARILLRGDQPADIERVFGFALRQPLLFRILVGSELMHHSALLAERAIPQALASSDSQIAARTLEFLLKWGRFVAVPEVVALASHSDSALRAEAVRALRYCALPDEAARAANRAMDDPAPAVRASGAWLAGKLHLESMVPALAVLLNDAAAETRLTAAYSLGEIGRVGWRILEDAVASGAHLGAAPALEALERARIGRVAEGAF